MSDGIHVFVDTRIHRSRSRKGSLKSLTPTEGPRSQYRRDSLTSEGVQSRGLSDELSADDIRVATLMSLFVVTQTRDLSESQTPSEERGKKRG